MIKVKIILKNKKEFEKQCDNQVTLKRTYPIISTKDWKTYKKISCNIHKKKVILPYPF